MNIQNRLRKLEKGEKCLDVCQCPENVFATSTIYFDQTRSCQKCGNIIKPSALVVSDLTEIEGFNYPVKIYAGIDINEV